MSRYSRHQCERAGYAMLIVLAFVTLFVSVLAIACSQLSSSILTETVRTKHLQRDEGSLHALARGLALLETGYPPSNPYVCGINVDTSLGPRAFTLTFTLDGPNQWTVRAAPTSDLESPPTAPLLFTSQSPPE